VIIWAKYILVAAFCSQFLQWRASHFSVGFLHVNERGTNRAVWFKDCKKKTVLIKNKEVT